MEIVVLLLTNRGGSTRRGGAGGGGCCGGVGCGNSAQAFAATGAGGGSSWIIIRRASQADGSSRSGFGSLWSHSLRPDCGSYVSSPHHGVQFSVSAADRSTVSFSLFFLFFWVSWKHGGEIKGRDIQEGNKHIFWRLFFVSWCSRKLEVQCV